MSLCQIIDCLTFETHRSSLRNLEMAYSDDAIPGVSFTVSQQSHRSIVPSYEHNARQD